MLDSQFCHYEFTQNEVEELEAINSSDYESLQPKTQEEKKFEDY